MGLVGLNDPGLRDQVDARLERLADLLESHADVERMLAAARSAPALPYSAPLASQPEAVSLARRPVIGYVRDDILWFYYEENLEALRRAGADLIRLELLDPRPWPRLDGLYLGGGFPENAAARIAASPRPAELRRLSEQGLPIYAECGGFMILCRFLRCGDTDHPMSDVFPTRALFLPRPQGLGYVEACADRDNPFHPQDCTWKGHEFHYSRCEVLENVASVLHLDAGLGMGTPDRAVVPGIPDLHGRDGLLIRNTFASYTHLFAPAVPHWAPRFTAACRAFAAARQGKAD